MLQAHHNFFHDADKVIIDRLDGIRDQRFPQRSHGLLFFNFYINYEHTHRTPDNIHTHSKPLRFNLLYEKLKNKNPDQLVRVVLVSVQFGDQLVQMRLQLFMQLLQRSFIIIIYR